MKKIDKDVYCLINAVRDGNKELVKLLVEIGVNVDIQVKTKDKFINSWDVVKDVEIAKLLINASNNDVIILANKENYPLHYEEKNVELAEFFIKYGVDVNMKNDRGETPLHTNGNIEVVKLLIKNGADVNTKNEQYETPLHTNNSVEVVKLLVEEHDLDVNEKDLDGNTPIHTVSDIEVAKFLLDNGADISLPNDQGELPIITNSNSAIELLLKSRMEKSQ